MKQLSTIVCLCLMFVLVHEQCFALEQDSGSTDASLEDLLNTEISTATRYDKKVSEVPASVTVISSEDIERYGYENLADALSTVPGFYTSYDRNYYYLGARGFSRPTDYNNRIKVLIDGHAMNENFYGSAGIGSDMPINLDAVERIEVVQGPGSALYGTGAMFAVVNVITKTSETKDGFQIAGHSGSFGEVGGSAVINKELSPQARMSLSGTWADIEGQNLYFPEFDQLATNYGVAEARDWTKYAGFKGALQYGQLTVSGYYSNGEKGVPTGAWEADFNSDGSYTLDRYSSVVAEYNQELSHSAAVNLRASYDHYFYEGTYPYGGFMTIDANWGDWIGGEAQLRWDVHASNRIVAGVEYQDNLRAEYRYWGEDGEVYYAGDHPYNSASFYVQDEFQARNDLSFTIGLRHDGYSVSGSHTSPRAAIVYHPVNTTTIKLLYGKAFRRPSLYEIYYEDPVLDYRSNHDLQPEDITTYELVFEQRFGKGVSGNLSVHSYKMKNLIDYFEHPDDGWLQYQNGGEASANGIEAGLRARTSYGLTAYGNYTFENARESISDEKLTNSPSHIVNAGLSIPFANHFILATDTRYESERTTIYNTKTDPFFIANLNFSVKPTLDRGAALAALLNGTKLSLCIKNLFDQEYSVPGGYEHIQDQIVQDGRTYRLTISHTF